MSQDTEDLMCRLLVQSATDYAICMLTPDGFVSHWHTSAERNMGYRSEDVVGQHFSIFYTEADRSQGIPEKALNTSLQTGKFGGKGWRLRKDGSKFWAHVAINPIRDEAGKLIGFARITRDATDNRKIKDHISHMVHHDSLTALLNRASFRDSVVRALNRGGSCALLYLDLHRFKTINALGHLVGDNVLQIVADRIAGQLSKIDIGGRLGGDVFAVLLVDCADIAAAAAASERLIGEIVKPISVDSFSVSVGVNIGMAFSGNEPLSPEVLLRNADLALHAAKKEASGTYRCYEPGMESALLQRKALERDLRLALIRNEFSLLYQPMVQATHDFLTGYEALIRWESPTRGKVSPADFIPFAEDHGLMEEIGDWVLQTACAEAAQWSSDLSVSINLSPAQFRAPNLVKRIAEILETTGLPPTRLELELTETAMIGDISAAQTILDELRSMGISVALDDFGTGYSSLSFLRMLPFTRIKIDKSFIQDLGKTQESLAIVRAVTGLCSSLGVATTAEGVETDEQMRILQREGCHELQGYLLGRPTATPERNGSGSQSIDQSHSSAGGLVPRCGQENRR